AGQAGLDEVQLESVLRRLSAGDLHILRPVSPRDGHGAVSYEIFHDALARPIADWRGPTDAARLESERRAREGAARAKRAAEAREARARQRKRWALAGLGGAIAVMIAGAIVFAIVQANRASDRKKTAQSIEAAERISGLSPAPS